MVIPFVSRHFIIFITRIDPLQKKCICAFQAFLLAQALKNGWRPTPPIALVPLIRDGPIIVIAPAALIAAFATTGRLNPRVTPALLACTAIALVLFGPYQCYSGISAILGTSPMAITLK
jgi:hypothetical protein